jgi:Tfp pilus assembly protein PilF
MSIETLLRDRCIPAMIVILAALLAYGSVVGYDFVRWDDAQLVTDNILVRTYSPRIFWTYDPELYIPLTLLSYQIDYFLAGFMPGFFHLTNFLLHATAALLVFAIAMHVWKDRRFALFGAVLFAVHPLHAEAVSWVSGRKELLMTMFSLASVLAYIRSEDGTRGRLLSLGFLLLALLSKATAIIVPFVLIATDLHREKIRGAGFAVGWNKRLIRLAPFFALSAAFAVIAYVGRGEAARLLSAPEVVLLGFRSTAFYLQKFFLPLGLSAIHPADLPITVSDPAIVLSIVIVIAVIAVARLLRNRAPTFTLGIAWFFIALVPSFLAYQKTNDVTLAAERYAYLPSVGLILALCAAVMQVMRGWGRAASCIGLCACLVLIPLARTQSRTWETSESLFQNVLSIYPDSHVAQNNIAFLRLNEGKLDEALALATQAATLKPSYADAWVNIGAIDGRMEKLDDAVMALRTALAIDPEHAQAHYNLGGVHSVRGNWREAEREYRETIRIKPSHAAAHFRLAVALMKLGSAAEAQAEFAIAVDLDPGFAEKSEELQ